MKIVEVEKPYKLINESGLEVSFLGTGSAFGRKLFNTNFLLVKGDTHLLVDFGITGPIALSSVLGVEITDIENILLTHSHSDHIGGVEYLALFNRYVSQPLFKKSKLNLIIDEEYSKYLWDHSLSGGMERNESTDVISKLYLNDYFNIINPRLITNNPRCIFEIDFKGIQLEIFATNHIPDKVVSINQAFFSYGIFVDDRILFSGDTKFDSDLFNLYGAKAEIIFHDCSFFSNPVHASLEELETLPKEIKSKMLLVHYGDDWEKYDVSNFMGLVHQGLRYIF